MAQVRPYVRIYFERSSGMAVVDEGPGTPRLEAKHLIATGTLEGQHATEPGARPRWWLAATDCRVTRWKDTLIVWSKS